MRTNIWWENLKIKDNFYNPYTNEKIILVSILKKHRGSVWTGVLWIRIGSDDKLL
jgi:hypothetical protein